jgi:MFS family permease
LAFTHTDCKMSGIPISPELRKERIALAAVFFALGGVFASWAGRIPQVQEHLSISDGQLGVSMFCLAVGTMISMPVSGAAGSRITTGRATSLFSLAFCLLILPIPFISSWMLLSICLFLWGFSMGATDVSMNAHAVQVERQYGRPIMSSFHGMFSAGAFVGGGFSALMCWLHLAVLWHFAIVVAVMVPAMLIAGRFFTAPKPDDVSDSANVAGIAGAEPAVPAPAFVLPDRHLIVLSLVAFCSFIGEGSIVDWSAVYLHHELHASAAVASAAISVFCFTMAVCRFFGDRVVQQLGTVCVLQGGGILAGSALAATLLVPSAEVALIFYAIAGIGFSCMVPVAFSAAGNNRYVAPSVGIAGVATVGYCGFIIAPPVIGVLADHFALRGALWMPTVLSLAVSALASGARE